MRLWFNKQFDELMALKKREVGLVCERNARLRFIIEGVDRCCCTYCKYFLHCQILR